MIYKYYFIENLSLISLVKIHKLIKSRNSENNNDKVFYINSNKFSEFISKIYIFIFSFSVAKFNFEFESLTHDNKSVYGFKKIHEDTLEIWESINKKEFFVNDKSRYFINYFAKNIVGEWPCYGDEISLNRLLLMFHATVDYVNKTSNQYKIIFLIDKRPWISELRLYATKRGIELIEIKPLLKFNKLKLRNKSIYNRYLSTIIRNISNIITYIAHNPWKSRGMLNLSLIRNKSNVPTIIIDQVMQLFGSSTFWKSSDLPHASLIFVCSGHKITQIELDEIRNNGMNFIALSRYVWEGLDAFFFYHIYKCQLDFYNVKNRKSWESKIIEQQNNRFITEKIYWTDLFKRCNTKIYATVHKWANHQIAASESINDLGGISVLWQSSFYETMGLTGSVNAIIYFPFSTKISHVEKLNNSEIKYIVAIGYVFDFNFNIAKRNARKIRLYLQKNNAKKILSIFDGGSSEDERWGVGNTYFRQDYQFILEKVLENKWLGLIIKSKKPGSLRRRLGDVSVLLDNVINTGRCFFSEETDNADKNESIRPAEVAYASDIAIHFCMYAGSAGLEAALTNTPTLLLDKYNLKYSQFYKLENEKVVFNKLPVMWNAICEHLTKKPIPRFGDWSPIINEIDSFRDGKAAQRLGTYLHWMNQGFEQGLERDVILSDTAERYGKQWGYDKIISVE